MAEENIDKSLSIIKNCVEKIISTQITVAHVFSSESFDGLCLQIGRKNLNYVDTEFAKQTQIRADRETVVYIVTRLQNSGGHSRLVLDFIRCQPDKNHVILATHVVGWTEKAFLDSLHSTGAANVDFRAAPNGTLHSRLTWLQESLISIGPKHVYLFNHHQDSVAAAALVPELGLKGSFCHHGDHHLCLGVHLEHLAHIDFTPMAYSYCRDELGIENQYLPLTFEDKGTASVKPLFVAERGLVTATAARSNKVEIPYYVSYLELIPKVLKVTGGRHIHIGKLTYWGLIRIRSQMHKLGLAADRFLYVESTPSVWKSLQKYGVHLYLASFPYGAGLTLIEALGAGIPVVLHKHAYSRLLSGLELAYPEAYHWSNPEKLLIHLAALKPEDLETESILARRQYKSFHHQGLLEEYFQSSDNWDFPVPPLVKDFKPRWDEWAALAESQMSISKLLYRFVYRAGLRMRAFISQRVGG